MSASIMQSHDGLVRLALGEAIHFANNRALTTNRMEPV
jgi:hypothetical protein